MKVLVTGAAGCLGGRILEKLVLEGRDEVRAMTRLHAQGARPARFAAAELVASDMSDAAAVDRAVEGCDVVIHCAHDRWHPERNRPGAEAIVAAALSHGVRRVVYLGSAAVHEPLADGVVDERSAVDGHLDGLDSTLIEAERVFTTAAADRGLPAAVLRPAIVYGPRSPHWTMWQAAQMRTGRVIVSGEGRGVCNAVYVDDVVDAAIHVSRLDHVGIGPYLLNGPDQVTWAEFHRALERALDVRSLVLQPDGEPSAAPQRTPAVRAALGSAKRIAKHERLRPVRKHTAGLLGPQLTRSLKRRVKRRLPTPVYAPDPRTRSLYTATARIDDARARAELGYAPEHDFERGMALTTAFLRWSNL